MLLVISLTSSTAKMYKEEFVKHCTGGKICLISDCSVSQRSQKQLRIRNVSLKQQDILAADLPSSGPEDCV